MRGALALIIFLVGSLVILSLIGIWQQQNKRYAEAIGLSIEAKKMFYEANDIEALFWKHADWTIAVALDTEGSECPEAETQGYFEAEAAKMVEKWGSYIVDYNGTGRNSITGKDTVESNTGRNVIRTCTELLSEIPPTTLIVRQITYTPTISIKTVNNQVEPLAVTLTTDNFETQALMLPGESTSGSCYVFKETVKVGTVEGPPTCKRVPTVPCGVSLPATEYCGDIIG